MALRDIEPVDPELLDEETRAHLEKVSELVGRIREENPDWRPDGVNGEIPCPICCGFATFSVTPRGGLYVECKTEGCVRLTSQPSPKDLRRQPTPDLRRKLL